MGSLEEFIKKYHLVVDNSKSSDTVLYIRSSIRTKEEAQSFMKRFGQKTSTVWKVHYGNYNPQRVMFRKAWVCRHSNIRSTAVQENNCAAKLDILVKKINHYTAKNDTFLLKKPPLPCIIRMHSKHNHNCEEDFKYLKVPDEVKELFNGYFDNGYGVSKAIRHHQEHMQRVKNITSVHFIPSKRQAYYLYRMWREQRSLIDIPCDDLISNEPWNIFDWNDFISAIPHENPPLKSEKKIALDSPNVPCSSSEKNASHRISETDELAVITNTDVILKRSNPVTVICPSNNITAKSTVLPTVYLLNGPVQTHHIANSSNHLNGSVLTVMNSNSIFSGISPFLVSSPVSSAGTPNSSTINLEAISSKPATNLVLLTKGSAPKNELNTKDTSKSHAYVSQSVTSNYLHQSKVLDLSSTAIHPNYLMQKNSNCGFDSNIQDSTVQFDIQPNDNSILPGSNRQISISGQICKPILKDIIIDTNSSINQNYKISSYGIVTQEKTNVLNSLISLENSFNNPKISFIETPTANTFLSMNSICSETSAPINTQIHITNTVHQSGAQICMKSPDQPNQEPIVNALHVSELLASKPSSNELIKIKEEPPEDLLTSYKVEESENSDFSPTIVRVSSISADEILTSEETIPVPNIKKEKDSVQDEPSICFLNNSANAVVSAGEDEDQLFLMSLLPELKQLPTAFKNKLKSDIQNLVSSANTLQNRRKRRKL